MYNQRQNIMRIFKTAFKVHYQKIIEIAVLPIIFLTDCLKKCEKSSAVFYTSWLYI